MAPHALKHARGALDVDWRIAHNGQKEWVEHDRRRNLRRLAQFQGLSLDGGSNTSHPWAALGDNRITPGSAHSGTRQRLATSSTNRPPATSSSRALSTSSGPPRTSSTSLSCLWRRALSTPALKGNAVYGSEEWMAADIADGLDQDELARLIEHVHSRVLRERERRREVESNIEALKGTKADARIRKDRQHDQHRNDSVVAARQPTPVARIL
mmetsp:Transcript_22988/g.36722  ORF Transcript_22988/g.36722 Transcript_22988/m.36722 type:complete len:212 (+) Transcript_22988:27-662(+)|eukprot:CAMPEP_0169369414 /NCGR_PEP_ID=MMETSP1017-20121227/34780_1 /TAXON_ID=342587 /ORGANISM="Karlodinium micrum, Strain CCMP2283" /LENGTH=211 /DNA_ID=CAMNT_0009467701 /DNA_START=14 /DNA_END=649 /DNA_ORIENTATION=+